MYYKTLDENNELVSVFTDNDKIVEVTKEEYLVCLKALYDKKVKDFGENSNYE